MKLSDYDKKYCLDYYYNQVFSSQQKEVFAEMIKKKALTEAELKVNEEKMYRYQSFISRHCKIMLDDKSSMSTDELIFYYKAIKKVLKQNPATESFSESLEIADLINPTLLEAA